MDQYKRFHKSESILYQYNLIQYPIPDKDVNFKRTVVRLSAAPGVTREDIASEFKSQVSDPMNYLNFQDRPMMTLSVDTPDFVVAMTTNSVDRLIKAMMKKERKFALPGHALSEADLFIKKLYDFADEMIYYRENPILNTKLKKKRKTSR